MSFLKIDKINLVFFYQKIKEIIYMYFEGIFVGELKYGFLVLVDKLMFVIMIIMRDYIYVKCQNVFQQVVVRQVS